MKITSVLYILSNQRCAHDYGTHFLATGLIDALGFENFFDWPEVACLHLPSLSHRDECQIDSDQCWPVKGHTTAAALAVADVAIIAVGITYVNSPAFVHASAVCRWIPQSMPIIGLDMTDEVVDQRSLYEQAAGRRLAAYFKRELPRGATWGIPLPFSYPASRVTQNHHVKEHKVFYWASDQGTGSASFARAALVSSLRQHLPPHVLDVSLTGGQYVSQRGTPEEYHEHMAKSMLGVSYNGAKNWDCNRFWENFAYGLCQVAQRPTIAIPNEPEHGKHCWYVDSPEQVGPAVKMLWEDGTLAREMAQAGHDHFLAHHSSEKRARYLLDHLEATI